MMMGSADGSDVPCSLSFMSFMAMENSNLSIFPSLFMSASVLTERRGEIMNHITLLKRSNLVENLQVKKLCVFVCVCACEHVSMILSRSRTISQPTLRQAAPTVGKTS